jgi:hypothetical protein
MVRKGLCKVEFGSVCACGHGKVGVVTKVENRRDVEGVFRFLYIGVGFDGSHWQSKNPEVLNSTVNEYIEEMI